MHSVGVLDPSWQVGTKSRCVLVPTRACGTGNSLYVCVQGSKGRWSGLCADPDCPYFGSNRNQVVENGGRALSGELGSPTSLGKEAEGQG